MRSDDPDAARSRLAHRAARGLVVALATLGAGCRIEHLVVRRPVIVGLGAVQLERIGPYTSAMEARGTIYVGGQKGVGAIDGTGKLLWALELPLATVRLVDADGEQVAWTAYDVVGLVGAQGLTAFLEGRLGDRPQYRNARVGLTSPVGQPVWSVECSAEALSPPALGPTAVGVNRGTTFAVYARRDGHETVVPFSRDQTGVGWDVGASLVAQATRARPAFYRGHFYAGFATYVGKFDQAGTRRWLGTNFGLLSPFVNVTLGPVVWRDEVIFATSSDDPNRRAKVFSARAPADGDPGEEWKGVIKDRQSGPGSLAMNREDVFIATNFRIKAFGPGGSGGWEAADGGGLLPSAYRGLRLVGNFGTRKSHGNLMVATDTHLYVATAHKDGDAITVLDARSGAYVESIAFGRPIVELLTVGTNLAIVTTSSIELVALGT